MKILKALLIILSFTTTCLAQTEQPEIMFQTGFATRTDYAFSFSPGGNYYLGQNELECLLWDTKSGQQLKKITYYSGEIPGLFYFPVLRFSNDDQRLLIPRYPSGDYELYDLYAHRTLQTFKQETSDGRLTHALFSADSKRILFLEQRPGKDHPCSLIIYTTEGKKLRKIDLRLPKLFDFPLWLKLIFSKSLKSLDKAQGIYSFTADAEFNRVYLGLLNGKVYAADLRDNRDELFDFDLQQLRGIGFFDGNGKMELYRDKLILKSNYTAKRRDAEIINFTDTLYVVNALNMQIETKKLSRYTGFSERYRSVGQPTLPIGSNQSLNVYFNTSIDGSEVNCFDILSDHKLFSYKRGRSLNNNSDGDYVSGTLNGGYVVALSNDQQLIAEYTREPVIHNVRDRTIRSVLGSAKGQLKLGAPLYLDNTHLFVPKLYNDGFLIDLKTAEVSRLSRKIDYADTANNGMRSYFSYDNTAQTGLETACLSSDGSLSTTDFAPQINAPGKFQKRIIAWDREGHKKATFNVFDRELTYHFRKADGLQNKFLINHKLYAFGNDRSASGKELVIVSKKDTFYALNTDYLPGRKMFLSVMATRNKPGNPNLIFATWDSTGRLIKQYLYKRKKSSFEYQALVYKSQLSPDSSQLLYTMHNGFIGIFDIDNMRVSSTYEHGELISESVGKLYTHTAVTAACFVDDQHFLSNGDDFKINLWTVGKMVPDRVINADPVFLYSMAVSPDKRYVTGVDINKTIHMINLKTGKNDLYFVAFNPDAYALIGAGGYYATNKQSGNELSFFYKGNTYGFGQFDLYLNRPDKVVEALGYAGPEQLDLLKQLWRKRIENQEHGDLAAETPIDRQAPECRLVGLPAVRKTEKGILRFSVLANGRGSTVSRLFVNINGVPIYGVKGFDISKMPQHSINVPVSASLRTGLNRFTVSVRNHAGVESPQQSFSILYSGRAGLPTLYLIAIGSGKFQEKDMNLKYAANDARTFVKLFASGKRFAQIIVDTLINAAVTRDRILEIRKKLKASRPDDQVILYYSGHGLFDKANNYYLSTYQSNMLEPGNGKSFDYRQLESLIAGIPAQNRLMLIDACYSGIADKSLNMYLSPEALQKQRQLFTIMRSTFADLNKGTGVSVITASSSFESAYEFDSLDSGVFMYFLKKGIGSRDADINGDGQITVSELAQYLDSEVSTFTEKSQRPSLRGENIVNDFVLF